MSDLNIEPRDQARIDKLGLLVSMSGSSYVVRHPVLKKRKHEGGNLSALITAAEMDLGRVKNKGAAREMVEGKPSLPGLKGRDPKKEAAKAAARPKHEGKTIAQAVAESPKHEPGEEPDDDKAAQKDKPASPPADDRDEGVTSPRKKSAAKPKRQQSDWKTYAVGRLILENPAKTPDEILAMCKEKGVETKTGTVYGLHRYFKLCVKILSDIAEKKSA